MCLIVILFKMDSSCQKQVPTIRPAPIGDSNSNITATILDNATEESQGIELQQLDPQKIKSEMSELPGLIQPNEPLLSQRPHLAAAVPDEDHSGLQNGSKLDKGSASSFIDQCIADHKIQTSVITPMDHVIIAQTLHNPHPDYQEEIITVQIVYQNLKIDDGTIQKEKQPQSFKKNFKHPLEMHDSHKSEIKECKLCELRIGKKEKHYSCKEKLCQEINNWKDFYRVCPCTCCAKCMLSLKLRRQLQKKTMSHNLVQLYHLDETDAQQNPEQKSNQNQGKDDLKIISSQKISIKRDTENPGPETILQKQKHAIVGLWRRNNSGYIECYRQFRIDHPVTQKRFLGDPFKDYPDHLSDLKLKPLFYVGDKGGLFYFTQKQTLDHLGAKKKEFYLQKFDLDQACMIEIDSIKLRPYYRNLYFPPIIGEKQAVGNVVDNLLQSVFFQDFYYRREYSQRIKKTLSHFEPQFLESAGYLALTVDKAAPLNDISSNNLVNTKYTNIFFSRLDQPSKIDKIIYNGCVVLKVNVTSNQITDVWYSCIYNLNQISWKNEIDQSQLTPAFLKENSPEQKLASCYAYSGKTETEDEQVKKKLESALNFDGFFTQIQGVMHNNDQRVSFVFNNYDFMTFEIDKQTNKAVLVWGNELNDDSRFCFGKDGSLFICFDLSHEEAQEKDQNSIKIYCRNLDAKKPDQSQNEVEQDDRRRDLKIEFKIGQNLQFNDQFCEKKKLPYQFTDFKMQIKDGKQEFMVSLHFLDSETYQPNLYFLKGKEIGLGDYEKCANQTFVRKQAATEYPIMIQNTDLPLQNQLLVTNLSLNEPQKLIDLGEYRFICFVETGLKINETFIYGGRVAIFFLALSPNGQIKLMKFETQPWPNFSQENFIKIYTGFILDAKLTQPTKIKGAALLFNYEFDLLMKIVVQFEEDIKVYSLNDPQYLKQLNPIQSQLEERTAKLHMVCNQNMIFYVKRYGKTEDKIICMHHKGLDIEELVAYTSSFQILQLQAKQDAIPTENEQSLYIIDSESRFIELKCNRKDLTFEVVMSQKMSKAEQIIHKLKSQKWQKLALSSRSVTTSFIKGKDGGLFIRKSAITQNLTSGSIFKHDFLGYKADVEIKNTKLGLAIKKNCQVFSVQHLAGIGKILLTVKEGNFCYQLLMQSLDNRRIDLCSHQPNNKYFFGKMKLYGNLIIAQDLNQSIIYEHNNLMQKQTQPFAFPDETKENCCINSEEIQGNYLQRFQAIFDKETNKPQKVDTIVRINTGGRFTTIFSSLKNYIDKQRDAIDNQLKKEFEGQAGEVEMCAKIYQDDYPVFFVTSKGTLVLSINLALSKQKESDVNEENKKVPEKDCTFQIVKFNLPYEDENLEIFNAGINDLTEDEKKVIIYVIKTNNLFSHRMEYRQTEDFFVITISKKIFFKKLADINDTVTKQESRSVDKIGEFNNFQGIKTLIESKEYCYEFQCIDLSQLFTQKEQQEGYKVNVMLGKQSDNVIQISFEDIVVLWDLEKNQELSQITNFEQFSTPETMIPSPFQFPIKQKGKSVYYAFLMEQTNDQNIFLQKIVNGRDCLFKMYTMLDLLQMQAIHQSLKKKEGFKNSTPIDPESVLAFFHGKTFFQLFQENPEVIQSFLMQLKEKNLQKFINKHDVESDNIYVRRLFRTLKAQTTDEDQNQESLIFKRYQLKVFEQPKLSGLNIFQEQLKQDSNLNLLETLLEIVLYSSEVDISIIITGVEHFKKVIDNIHRSWVSAFMNKVFKTNAQTEEVYNMLWDEKNKIVVFTANSSQLSSQEIKKQAQVRIRSQATVSNLHSRLIDLINRKILCKKLEPPNYQLKLVPVTVKIIEISWLTSDKLKDFYLSVTCSNNETLYDMELIRVLLTSQDYSWQLIYRIFFPYMILMGAVLYYFGVCVNIRHTEGFFGGEAVGLRCFIFAYQLFFLGVEVMQMHILKKHYWTDTWNFVYLLQYALNYLVIMEHSTSCFGLDHSQLTQFTACSTVLLWTILFYWMRIFDELGFYVYLIIETLKDTKSFLILVLMVVITFANALYILEIANHPSDAARNDTALTLPTKDGAGEIDLLIKRAYNVTFIDSVVNQFLLGLGEFQYDAFASSPSGPLIWSLFLLSTFLIQVTFMNMLIAIMSDTFSRVLDKKERYGLQQKTEITADFIQALSLSKMITEKRYLYIIEPDNTSKSQEAIESSIENLKKSLASENIKYSQLIREDTHKATSGILTQVQQISNQMTHFTQVLNGQSGDETQRDHSTVFKRPTLPRQRFSQGKDSKVEASQEKIGIDAKVDALSKNMDALSRKTDALTANMGATREEMSANVETLTANIGASREELSAKVETLTANMGATREEMSANVENLTANIGVSREELSAKVETLTANMGAKSQEMSAKVETLTAKVDAQAKQMTAIQDLLQKLINQRLN